MRHFQGITANRNPNESKKPCKFFINCWLWGISRSPKIQEKGFFLRLFHTPGLGRRNPHRSKHVWNYVDPPKQISAVDVEMKMRGSALAEISWTGEKAGGLLLELWIRQNPRQQKWPEEKKTRKGWHGSSWQLPKKEAAKKFSPTQAQACSCLVSETVKNCSCSKPKEQKKNYSDTSVLSNGDWDTELKNIWEGLACTNIDEIDFHFSHDLCFLPGCSPWLFLMKMGPSTSQQVFYHFVRIGPLALRPFALLRAWGVLPHIWYLASVIKSSRPTPASQDLSSWAIAMWKMWHCLGKMNERMHETHSNKTCHSFIPCTSWLPLQPPWVRMVHRR